MANSAWQCSIFVQHEHFQRICSVLDRNSCFFLFNSEILHGVLQDFNKSQSKIKIPTFIICNSTLFPFTSPLFYYNPKSLLRTITNVRCTHRVFHHSNRICLFGSCVCDAVVAKSLTRVRALWNSRSLVRSWSCCLHCSTPVFIIRLAKLYSSSTIPIYSSRCTLSAILFEIQLEYRVQCEQFNVNTTLHFSFFFR